MVVCRRPSGLRNSRAVTLIVGCPDRNKGVCCRPSAWGTYARLNPARIYTFFLSQIATLVDGPFRGYFWRFAIAIIPDDHQLPGRLALQLQCAIVEAGLCFVIHTHRALAVALKRDRTEGTR